MWQKWLTFQIKLSVLVEYSKQLRLFLGTAEWESTFKANTVVQLADQLKRITIYSFNPRTFFNPRSNPPNCRPPSVFQISWAMPVFPIWVEPSWVPHSGRRRPHQAASLPTSFPTGEAKTACPTAAVPSSTAGYQPPHLRRRCVHCLVCPIVAAPFCPTGGGTPARTALPTRTMCCRLMLGFLLGLRWLLTRPGPGKRGLSPTRGSVSSC